MQTKNLLVLSVMAIAYTLLWFAMAALLGARIHDPLFQGLFAVVMIATFTFSYTPLYAAVQMSVRNLRGGIPATTSAGFAQMINALHEQTQLDALVDLVEKRLLVLLGQSSARLVLTMPGRAELSPEFAGNRSMWDTLRMTRAPVTADALASAWQSAKEQARLHKAPILAFVLPAAALGHPDTLRGAKLHVTTWDYDGRYRSLSPEPHAFDFGGGDGRRDPLVMDEIGPIVLP